MKTVEVALRSVPGLSAEDMAEIMDVVTEVSARDRKAGS